MKKRIATIILSYNSDAIIKKTILAAKKISKNVIVLDSFSNDNTLKIARSLQCKIFKKKFINYSFQRNYIIKKCNKLYEWQLHLDSDEILSKKLIKNIGNIVQSNDKNYSYIIKRRTFFLNKKLSFGGTSNWHLRLFPSGTSACEHKKYDQHFISKLKSKKISGELYDMNIKNLRDWIDIHNKWSTLDANDYNKKNSKNRVQPKLFGNNIERLRFYKSIYDFFPWFIRSFILFIIKYVLLFGFLDGKAGFYFCFFHSLWFRTLIDAKKYEIKLKKFNKL